MRPSTEPNGVFYSPADSIIVVFPAAVKVVTDTLTNPEHKAFQEYLCEKCGVSHERLKEALNCFVKYFDVLLQSKAKDDVIGTLKEAGVDPENEAFLVVQLLLSKTLMTIYHEKLVDFSSCQPEYAKSCIYDAFEFIRKQLVTSIGT